MAPSQFGSNVAAHLQRRQDVPSCVTTCMATGDIGICESLLDLACLCSSETYVTSVAACWSSTCTPDEMITGQAYSANACLPYVGGNSTDTNGTTGALPDNSTVPGIPIIPEQTPVITTGDPEIFRKAFLNVQAIMSSICGALLLTAIVLGGMACRNRLRRDRENAQRSTWTGVGNTTFGQTDTKGGKSNLFSGSHSSNFANLRNANNFGMTSSNFGGTTTIDLPEPSRAATTFGFHNGERSSVNRSGGFTNRLAPEDEEEGPASEQWEMTVQRSSSNSLGSPSKSEHEQRLADSPTTPTTRFGGMDSEVNLGSTAELTKHQQRPGRGEAF